MGKPLTGLLTVGEQTARILGGAGRAVNRYTGDEIREQLGIARTAPPPEIERRHETTRAIVGVYASSGKAVTRVQWPPVDQWMATYRRTAPGRRAVEFAAELLDLDPETYTLDDFRIDDDTDTTPVAEFANLARRTAPITESKDQRFVVAYLESTGEPVAWGGVLWATPTKARMKALFCRPEWRGVGIGDAVTVRCMEIGLEYRRDVEAFAIDSRWYTRNGFSVVAERANGGTHMMRGPET